MRSPHVVFVLGLLAGCGSNRPGQAEVERWRLVEELRIGSGEEGPTSFADLRGIEVDQAKQIWAVEFQSQEIRVFDSTGAFVRAVGRKGQGPGEFVYADGLARKPDGTIWVHDPQAMRFTGFQSDGTLIGSKPALAMGYGYTWDGAVDSIGRTWDMIFVPADSGAQPTTRLRRFSADWSAVDTVDYPACASTSTAKNSIQGSAGYAQIPFVPGPLQGYHGDDLFACLPTSAEYRGTITRLIGGDTVATFSGASPMAPIPQEERDEEVKRFLEFGKRIQATATASMVPTERPTLVGLRFDDQRRLWVQRLAPDGGTVFDVFSGSRKVAEARSPVAPVVYFRAVFVGPLVYFIVSGPDDVPQIVRLRVEPDTGNSRVPS